MINYKTVHKILFTSCMLILFVFLMFSTLKFEFLQLTDLRLLAILILATSILILLGTDDLTNFQELSNKFRFNLFFTAMLMSLMMIYHLFSQIDAQAGINRLIRCLKPVIFSLIIYLPVINLINRFILKNQKYKSNHSELQNLSRRETEVYNLAMKGLSNKDISGQLYIAESTVKKHMQNILKKTNCENRHVMISKYKSSSN